MTKARREILTELLNEKRATAIQEVARLSESDSRVDHSTKVKYRNFITILDHTISEHEKGSYGKCITCGGEVETEILVKNFQAVRCTPCYEKVHVYRIPEK